jgi:hypothetical protein
MLAGLALASNAEHEDKRVEKAERAENGQKSAYRAKPCLCTTLWRQLELFLGSWRSLGCGCVAHVVAGNDWDQMNAW